MDSNKIHKNKNSLNFSIEVSYPEGYGSEAGWDMEDVMKQIETYAKAVIEQKNKRNKETRYHENIVLSFLEE